MRNILTKFQRKSLKYPHILLTIDIPKLYIPNLNFKKLCNNIENRYMDFRNLLSSLNILCHATILYKIDYHKKAASSINMI